MSSIHGKNSLSFRKAKTGSITSSTSTISKDIEFAHKATAGETQINLAALVTPTEMVGFSNLSGTQLASINLKSNINNLILVSSLRGTLQSYLSYSIPSSQIISLNFSAAEGEIFTGQIRTTQAAANVVDGQTFTATGTLLSGNTDIALGQAFNRNACPTKQIGEIVLYLNGIQQFRNTGNATAIPAADGNYEEVDAGGGLTNVLRLNSAVTADTAWAVVSAGIIIDSSGNYVQQQLDALSGQLDVLVPTVAALAGVPETNFQAGPNNVDLKAFADKLYTASQDIITNKAAQVAGDAALEVSKQNAFTIDWQSKTGSISGLGILSSITFNNLVVGKTYRVSGNIWFDGANTVASAWFGDILNNGVSIFPVGINLGDNRASGDDRGSHGFIKVFTATGVSLQMNTTAWQGPPSSTTIDWTLEELPNHKNTSKWL
jgi:hypothetical protein